MNITVVAVLSVLGGIIIGFGGFVIIRKMAQAKKRKFARTESDRILSRAKQEASRIERRAKDQEIKIRKSAEKDIERLKQNLLKSERQVKEKEQQLKREQRESIEEIEESRRQLNSRAETLDIQETRIKKHEKENEEERRRLVEKLERAAHISADEAKKELVEAISLEAKNEAAKEIRTIEEHLKEDAEKKAKRIIGMAISRYAGEYTTERTVSVLALPSEEMKGRIIGREGRNIRALEAACGVDLIVDDTPEAVVISGFDPVRREVARRTLETLMEDGRVHPARIEEVIQKIRTDLFKSIQEDGEKACLELGVHGVNKEIIKLVGSLKYRTSFTQNNYTHSIEAAFIASVMAAELGVDTKKAKRATLLHDIGKALDHSIEGGHAVIGAEFAKRHGESEEICHAIRAHHGDEPMRTSLAYIVQAADAISGARPGARRSMAESYVKRMEDLESIGNSFDGVIRTFAIQAGREVRVLVEGSKVTDEQAVMLSRDIARKIEKEMNFPGQIKVTVVRETRAVDHAR